jgi:hypothetical protein
MLHQCFKNKRFKNEPLTHFGSAAVDVNGLFEPANSISIKNARYLRLALPGWNSAFHTAGKHSIILNQQR